MSSNSAIEWTEHTWNPVVGCSIVSPGCTNCYAMRWAGRAFEGTLDRKTGALRYPHYQGTTHRVNGKIVWTGKVSPAPDHILDAPLHWRKPSKIFVNSMGDLFHESVPDEWIDRVFAVMALASQHTFQVLTKRSARMREYMSADRDGREIAERLAEFYVADPSVATRWPLTAERAIAAAHWPLPNVWLGVSAEDQARADERIPDLLATPAAVRFVSYEPALGPIDFRSIPKMLGGGTLDVDALTGMETMTPLRRDPCRGSRLDWIIAGGESGAGARASDPEWFRCVLEQCEAAGVAFFMKQITRGGEKIPQLDWPADLRVQQYPGPSA
jgi:protein gp37